MAANPDKIRSQVQSLANYLEKNAIPLGVSWCAAKEDRDAVRRTLVSFHREPADSELNVECGCRTAI
jgi:hypothetical protein